MAAEPGPVGRPAGRSLLGAAGAIAAAAALALSAGPLGVPAGVAVVGAWALLSIPYVLAVAHLGLAVLFPGGPALEPLVLVEAGLLVVLAAPFVDRNAEPRTVAGAVAAPVALLGVVAAGLRWLDSLALTALGLAAAASLLAYGLHRHELLRLGLVEP